MIATQQQQTTVAIIGGGVAGALTAYQLIEQSRVHRLAIRVIVIDPRPELGLGLAFSTPSMRHLLNVPTSKISALPHDPDHFLRWIHANYDADAKPFSFMPRAIFGKYIRSIYAQVADSIEHLQTTVTDLHKTSAGITLTVSMSQKPRCPILREVKGGTNNAPTTGLTTLHADYVVFATGNFDPPMLPNIAPAAIANGLYCNNAWLADTFDNLAPDASITLIGTGLTAVDVLLRLRELGHRGTVTALSRHGLFSSRHVETAPAPAPVIDSTTPRTALAYLRAIRAAMRSGIPWRAAIDSIRLTTNDLWFRLPLEEQRRFRRHLLHRWYIVRHRMAPAIADFVDDELAAGTLVVREGAFAGITVTDGAANVSITTHNSTESFAAARVINCTGPGTNYRKVDSPLMQSIFAQGIATSGPHLGAFNTTATGAMIDAKGHASPILFNLGPGRLGTVIETIAIPEIRQQAFEIATLIATRTTEALQQSTNNHSQVQAALLKGTALAAEVICQVPHSCEARVGYLSPVPTNRVPHLRDKTGCPISGGLIARCGFIRASARTIFR
jgi:hydroxyacylglutathione hydrolase